MEERKKKGPKKNGNLSAIEFSRPLLKYYGGKYKCMDF